MQRREFLTRLSGLAAAGLAAGLLPSSVLSAKDNGKKMNVLFIAVDDLRPQLGCYGQKQMITPNLDKLANEGALFTRTYCQQAVCSPSRSSLLTGTRPDTTKVWDLETHFRAALPDAVTLPQHFKNNGYQSIGIGKIFHNGYNDPPSWSEPWMAAKGRNYALEENFEKIIAAQPTPTPQPTALDAAGKAKKPKGPRGTAFECADVADTVYADGQTAQRATEILKRIKDKPFFVAVGFNKPHLPFNAPKKYWDLYDPAKIDLADNPFLPKGCPPMAPGGYGELRQYHGMPNKAELISDDLARQLIHGYYAATSYMDAQVGRVLQALEAEGLKENTIVILWGDHGWQLGEHGMWCKHTNFEVATHAPMILRVPGMKKRGLKIDALTEFVDIYPTLCELAGLPLPDHLEGTSMAPLLKDPKRAWKKAAFSQYPRMANIMGYTMRTDRYRYTEWRNGKTGKTDAFEIYDHEKDPEENVNLAAEEGHDELRQELAKVMKAGWQGARP